MLVPKRYNLFISHAWNISSEYQRLIDLLDSAPLFFWRNYSVPNDNPIHSSTEPQLRARLKNQIRPASIVLVISGMYVNHREWIQYEIDVAQSYGKPIIGIKPRGNQRIPIQVREIASDIVGWNTNSIVDASGGMPLGAETTEGRRLDHLMEQYKLYVEMADRVSQRRDQSNRFYVTILAALAAILVVVSRFAPTTNGLVSSQLPVVFIGVAAFGSMMSIIWIVNLWAYRNLNEAKFDVINELEKNLPFEGFTREWRILTSGNRFTRRLRLSKVEQFAPIIVLLFFVSLGAYSALCL